MKRGALQIEGFAERLVEARTRLYLTQREVCEKAGLPLRTYQGWETGKSMPMNGDKMTRLADALGVNALWLVTGEGERNGRGHDRDDDQEG